MEISAPTGGASGYLQSLCKLKSNVETYGHVSGGYRVNLAVIRAIRRLYGQRKVSGGYTGESGGYMDFF